MEWATQSQLQKHLDTSELINHNSHAYRTNYSTATAILQMTEKLYTATDQNLVTQLLAIYQSSAFDCVSFEILKVKLQRYGCNRNAIKWIDSYLDFRSQYTNNWQAQFKTSSH